MAMPEASVHKDCYFSFWKDKIWSTDNIRVSAPTGDFTFSQ
jgi:hypothetical protein